MTREELMKEIGEIDERFIEEASDRETSGAETSGRTGKNGRNHGIRKNRRNGKFRILKYGALAACFVGVWVLGAAVGGQYSADQTGVGTGARSTSLNAVTKGYDSAGIDAFEQEAAVDYDDSADSYALDSAADVESGSDSYSGGIAGSMDGSSSGDGSGITDEAFSEDKLVYTCNLSIQTKDYTGSKAEIQSLIQQYGGILESETESNSDYSWYLSDGDRSGYMNWYLTIRIPSEQYDAFLNSAGEIGKVISKSSSVDNISKQYYSTENRIKALETQMEKLQEMLEEAETVEDMITVESRISEVEAELNDYRTSLEDMDTDVAYSTIYLNLQEVAAYQTNEKEELTFTERIRLTFENSWFSFKKGMENFLYGVIFLLPYLAVLACAAVVILILRVFLRRFGKRRADKTDKKK